MLITKGLHSHFPLAVYICTRLSPSLPPSKRAAVRPIQLLHDDGDRDGDREMAADSFSSLPSFLSSLSFLLPESVSSHAIGRTRAAESFVFRDTAQGERPNAKTWTIFCV